MWVDAAPAHWRRIRLKNLIEHVRNGTWGEEPDADQVGTVCIRAADFDRQRNRVSEAKLVRRSLTPVEVGKHRLQPGDLVLEKSGGGDRQPVGAAVIFDLDIPAVPTNFAARVRPAQHVEPRFLNYVLRATYDLGINQRSIKQTTGLQNLDADSFFSERWAAPDREEQRAIADFLDRETARIDALIAKKHRIKRLLQERARIIVSEVVTGSRDITTSKEFQGAPARPIGAFAAVQLGRQRTPKDDQGPHMVPYLRAANVKDGVLDLSDVKQMNFSPAEQPIFALTPGDVLVTEGAGSLAAVGASTIWNGEINGTVCFQNTLIRLRPRGDNISPSFLYWWARHAYGSGLFAAEATGANIFHLGADRLRTVQVTLPSPTGQEEIVRYLEMASEHSQQLIGRQERQLGLLQEHRQALITAAVTGQMDIPSAA
jgi:type I restriction enzyme S subunit